MGLMTVSSCVFWRFTFETGFEIHPENVRSFKSISSQNGMIQNGVKGLKLKRLISNQADSSSTIGLHSAINAAYERLSSNIAQEPGPSWELFYHTVCKRSSRFLHVLKRIVYIAREANSVNDWLNVQPALDALVRLGLQAVEVVLELEHLV